MSSTTNTRWRTDASGGFPLDIHGADGQLVARVQPCQAAHNVARRIVACVNACEGIPTDYLEGSESDAAKIAKAGYGEVLKLRDQRDQLLKALAPFADIGSTGFKGTMFEDQPDSAAILYHHETGKRVMLGDFKRIVELVACAKGGAA